VHPKISSHVFQQLENCACGSARIYIYHNETTFAATIDAFSGLSIHPKCVYGRGSAPSPAGEAYRCSLRQDGTSSYSDSSYFDSNAIPTTMDVTVC